MHRVGIALGSNLGDRLANLQAARNLLLEISESPILQSSVYQTEPVFCPEDSPDFYNSVVEISYSGTPFELLDLTQGIEKSLGRTPKTERNAPRVIDVDLLYFGNEIVDTELLDLPHPRIPQRRFVLQPLAEIRPDLLLPGQQVSVSDLLRSLVSEEPPLGKATPNW
ncbi:MAG: 2-amino-4-hydroxy-6-hydroxymethyldihydropteridine diphosphokinase [Luteolibacter sp.]